MVEAMPMIGRQPAARPLRSWPESEELFVERLVSLRDGEERNSFLQQYREYLSPSVVQLMKDRVGYLIRADIGRATRLAAATREVAAVLADARSWALAHHASALALYSSGCYVRALEEYQQAEAIYTQLGEEVEAARVSRAMIGVLVYLGEYEKALQVAAQASEVFRRYDQGILLAQTLENMGNIYHRLDQYREALRYYHRAQQVYEAEQYDFGLASVRLNAANQYTCLNEFERALRLYRQARAIYQRLDMPLLVNQAEYSIAWLCFQRGQLQESLRLLARVSARARGLGDTLQEALCDLDLAEIYLQLNACEESIESARSAAEKFRALGMNYERVKAQMYLGISYVHLNDLTAAERELQQARHGFLAEGNEVFTAVTDLCLSDVFTRQRRWSEALHFCAEAKEIFDRQGLPIKAAYAELQLARLKLQLGAIEEAQQRAQSARVAIGEREVPWLQPQCLHVLGNILEQTGHTTEAYTSYTQAVAHLERLRSAIGVDEFKCTFLKDKLPIYEDLIELCTRVGTGPMIEAALQYAEAAKSRTLVELLAANQSFDDSSDHPWTARLDQEIRRVRQELHWYYRRIDQYEARSCGKSQELTGPLYQAARQCERQLARLIRQRELEDTERATVQAVPIAELRHCLAEDELVIEYYLVKGRVKVFVLSPETIQLFNDITTVDAVSPLLRQLRFCLDKFTLSESYVQTHQATVQAFTDWCLERLYAELVAPVAPLLEGKKLLFVPHGLLHYVPFHALHDGRRYLIEQYEVSYCPSAGVFRSCVQKARSQPAAGSPLIVGVPDEATPFITDEVEAVGALWPDARVRLGSEATLECLRREAPQARLLHLATHAVFRRDNPSLSALKLTDAWLSFYDLFTLKLNAELVTLSGCDTGLNGIYPGDELFGLLRGFLYAGTPSLIVSGWVVKDRSTAEFMQRLYQGLSQGLSKRAALRQAQLQMLRAYVHPYYWAPFMLLGNPW